jgi:hypothetical protein
LNRSETGRRWVSLPSEKEEKQLGKDLCLGKLRFKCRTAGDILRPSWDPLLPTHVGLFDLFPAENTIVLCFKDTRKRANDETCIQFCYQTREENPDGNSRLCREY